MTGGNPGDVLEFVEEAEELGGGTDDETIAELRNILHRYYLFVDPSSDIIELTMRRKRIQDIDKEILELPKPRKYDEIIRRYNEIYDEIIEYFDERLGTSEQREILIEIFNLERKELIEYIQSKIEPLTDEEQAQEEEKRRLKRERIEEFYRQEELYKQRRIEERKEEEKRREEERQRIEEERREARELYERERIREEQRRREIDERNEEAIRLLKQRQEEDKRQQEERRERKEREMRERYEREIRERRQREEQREEQERLEKEEKERKRREQQEQISSIVDSAFSESVLASAARAVILNIPLSLYYLYYSPLLSSCFLSSRL